MLHSSPWIYAYSHCHQSPNNSPRIDGGSSEVTQKSRLFIQPMPA